MKTESCVIVETTENGATSADATPDCHDRDGAYIIY